MVAVLSLIRSQASLGVGSPGTDTNQYSAIALHQRGTNEAARSAKELEVGSVDVACSSAVISPEVKGQIWCYPGSLL